MARQRNSGLRANRPRRYERAEPTQPEQTPEQLEQELLAQRAAAQEQSRLANDGVVEGGPPAEADAEEEDLLG